jgi:hypothetical protein
MVGGTRGKKDVSMITTDGIEITEGTKKKADLKKNRFLAQEAKAEKTRIEGGDNFFVLIKSLVSGLSFKSLIIPILIFIFIFALSYLLPKILPYKETTGEIKNISLDTIFQNQKTEFLFKSEKEFYEGKLYMLNDGSKDFGTFLDKDTCLKEASTLGTQVKVFEVEKSNNIEISRTQIFN